MNKIEKLIDNKIKMALKGKQAFYENLQLAYEIFVSHYNNELNHNSKPLLDILKASGKDILTFKDYVKKSTNITKLKISDKGGLLLEFDGEFTFDNDFIDNNKWWVVAKKLDKQAINEIDDKALLKRLTSLLNAIDKSTKLTVNKERVKNSLTALQSQLKQATSNSK